MVEVCKLSCKEQMIWSLVKVIRQKEHEDLMKFLVRIENAMKMLHLSKAPSLDGFLVEIFKTPLRTL